MKSNKDFNYSGNMSDVLHLVQNNGGRPTPNINTVAFESGLRKYSPKNIRIDTFQAEEQY